MPKSAPPRASSKPVAGDHAALAADIGAAMVRGSDLGSTLDGCVRALVSHLGAAFARVWTASASGDALELRASAGLYTHLDGAHAKVRVGELKIGRIAAERRPHLTNDVAHDPWIGDPAWARGAGLVAFAGYPLVVGDRLVGVMALFAKTPLPDDTLEALAAVADTMALGIVRLLDAAERTHLLADARASAARAEHDKEIVQSLMRLGLSFASERDPSVLVERVTREATRLVGATIGAYFHNVPDHAGHLGLYTLVGAPREAFARFGNLRPTPLFAASFEGRTLRFDDVAESDLFGRNPPHAGFPKGHPKVTSYLAVPVPSPNGPVFGVLLFGHPERGRFSAEDEGLVQSLAAHASVALENAELLRRERAARVDVQEQKALLDLIIEQTGEGIVMADEAGVIRVFNPAAEEQHGVSKMEVSAPDWARTFGLFTMDGRPLPLEETPLFRAVSGERSVDAEWIVSRPDGQRRTLLGTATPLKRKDGSSAGGVLITRDETARRREHAERERLLAALAKSNAELDQFAYVASHDLKAPLRGIANLSQWVEEDLGEALGRDSRENLRLLRGRVHRLEKLIDGILQYARAGRVKDRVERLDTRTVIAEAIELLAPRPEVVVTMDAQFPVLDVERVPFQQVFLNLVGNAVKYARPEGGRVHVSVKREGAFQHFQVADDGPGIAPEYHERIWGIFQTLHARDEVEGTGIGLSVVKKIVESRGGRTWVDAEESRGATFHVLWPMHPEQEKGHVQ